MLKSISNLLPHSSARFKFLYHSPSTTKSPCILRFLSTNPSPYPLQYELIINRPDLPKTPRRPPPNSSPSTSHSQPEPESQPETLNDWLDSKLTSESEPASKLELDKSKRKYYNKRRKRMYGSDSDEDNRLRHEEQFVELKPQVVEFPTLHRREEELYFYDAFAYPWEKEKHYKMVYQLEKKYFPDQCLDKAFLQPGQSNPTPNTNPNPNSNSNSNSKSSSLNSKVKKEEKKVSVGGDNKLVFFEEKGEEKEKEKGKDGLTEKKVEEFFKGLKKVPNKDVEVGEPFFSSRRTGLPPIWDSPYGTVLLVNKPKGEWFL